MLRNGILRALEAPVAFEDHLLDVAASIGVATFPEHGADPHVLMSHADAAMYHAKRRRLGLKVYVQRLDAEPETDRRFSLSGELRQAVERDEFVLYYQPRVSLLDSHACEVETLVRWQHPTRGFLPPNDFIPFAEQTGYICDITHWVMDAAFAQSVRWRAQGLPISISINLSVRDLLSAGFAVRCGELLERHAASPHWFTLEITESVIMDDPERAFETAHQLHTMGFSLSIDDFGTGYSSLALIKKLPVMELKIDRSFVMNMVTDADDMTIVRSVIDLAHNMGLVAVAEDRSGRQGNPERTACRELHPPHLAPEATGQGGRDRAKGGGPAYRGARIGLGNRSHARISHTPGSDPGAERLLMQASGLRRAEKRRTRRRGDEIKRVASHPFY